MNTVKTDEDYIFIKQTNQGIKPTRIIENNIVYKILDTPADYIIDNYNIVLMKDGLNENLLHLKGVVILNAWHPNASDDPNNEKGHEETDIIPDEQLFCLPKDMIDMGVEEDSYEDLITRIYYLLETWNYDNSYWKQWLNIKYEEQINMNETEVETKDKLVEASWTDIISGLRYAKTRSISLKLIKLKYDLEMINYSTYRNIPNPSALQKLGLILAAIDDGQDHWVEYAKWRYNNEG